MDGTKPPFQGFPLAEQNELQYMQAMYEASRKERQASRHTPGMPSPIQSRYSSLPTPRGDQTTGAVAALDPVSVLSYPNIPPGNPSTTPLNMLLSNTIASQRMMVKECVKFKLFRRVKFYKKDVHGVYDLRKGSVCALIIANCNVELEDADEHWWADMRKLVGNTHTDRRNNVIKNMRLRFRGKFAYYLMAIADANQVCSHTFCFGFKMVCVVRSHTLKLTMAKRPIWNTC